MLLFILCSHVYLTTPILTIHYSVIKLSSLPVCVWSKVCESSGGAEALDLRVLASLTAEMMVSNIHNRLVERPAGMGLYTSTTMPTQKHTPTHCLKLVTFYFKEQLPTYRILSIPGHKLC